MVSQILERIDSHISESELNNESFIDSVKNVPGYIDSKIDYALDKIRLVNADDTYFGKSIAHFKRNYIKYAIAFGATIRGFYVVKEYNLVVDLLDKYNRVYTTVTNYMKTNNINIPVEQFLSSGKNPFSEQVNALLKNIGADDSFKQLKMMMAGENISIAAATNKAFLKDIMANSSELISDPVKSKKVLNLFSIKTKEEFERTYNIIQGHDYTSIAYKFGVSVVVAAILAYFVKKLFEKKQQAEETQNSPIQNKSPRNWKTLTTAWI